MYLLGRRGFTLVEVTVAVVLLGILAVAVYNVLVNHQRLYMAQTQQIDLQQNLRTAGAVLPAEFRELDAADSDITAMSSTSITMRAMRKLAFICIPPVLGGGIGNISFTVRATPMYGRNLTFNKGDSLLIYYEGDPSTRSDDTWLRAKLTGVVAGTCVDSLTTNPGYTLTMQPQWLNVSQNFAGAITRGAPLRGFDNVTYALWQNSADNQWYIAQTNNTTGGSPQPMIGPLTGSAGFELDYFDAAGNVTAVNTNVAQIEMHVRVRTAAPVRQPGTGVLAYKVDSITTRVALRNNPRCGPCK